MNAAAASPRGTGRASWSVAVTTVEPVASGWEEWEWDDTLFGGAAAYYARGRLPNSPDLADGFQDALGLSGTGRLLDVGCGPGTVALRIAHLFEAVVGIDADADMVEEARRLSTERGLPHARWVHMRAESLPEEFVETILTGWWTTCLEVLPAKERARGRH